MLSLDKTESAPMADLQLFGSYSRSKPNGEKETWGELCDRILLSPTAGLFTIAKYTNQQKELVEKHFRNRISFPSGRFLWCGGTPWLDEQKNWHGTFNCVTRNITSIDDFALCMDLSMMGCGVGTVLEPKYINQLPSIKRRVGVKIVGEIGENYPTLGTDHTLLTQIEPDIYRMWVGDSRQGWVKAYWHLLNLATQSGSDSPAVLKIDLGFVRPAGIPLKGFGGVANPGKLPAMFLAVARVLSGAIGRKLDAVECCLVIDEAAMAIIAGGIRRSAGIRQFSSKDEKAVVAKAGLWVEGKDGKWRVDPFREALTMANHTRVFHEKPSRDECRDSVRKQWFSGEGAIQWAGETLARANQDLLNTPERRRVFLNLYPDREAGQYLAGLYQMLCRAFIEPQELSDRMSRIGLNPCFTGDMRLLTADGYKRFDELEDTKPLIINMEGTHVISQVWCSGEKETVSLRLTNGESITCTEDHVILTTSGEKQAKNCKGEQLNPYLKKPEHDSEFVVLGFVQGDGITTKIDQLGDNGIYVNVGKKDQDILYFFDAEEFDYIWHGERHIYVSGIKQKLIRLEFQAKPLPERSLPLSYQSWEKSQKAAFLNGLYSANGSVIANGRIAFKTTCKKLADEIKNSLQQDFGIEAYITTNKTKPVEFSNGVYQCRESYDINIQRYQCRLTFFNEINFSLGYRSQKLAKTLLDSAPAVRSINPNGIQKVYDFTEPLTHWGVVEGFVVHNCGEKIGNNNHCNLGTVHLAQLDPKDFEGQRQAFEAAALMTVPFLHRNFAEEKFARSRNYDPIVLISFTEAFDFFTRALGLGWIEWWAQGRPKTAVGEVFLRLEQQYLITWRDTVHQTVWDYCDKNRMRRPNRCTGVKPEGSLTLLTGVGCCGVHPPKAWRYIRRKEFRKNDPVALAAIDYGYSVMPARSDKDEQGNLLNDPFDPRCTTWVVEVPVEEAIVREMPELEEFPPSQFSALAQMDWFMQVQQNYSTHNTSSTVELRQSEIEAVGDRIYELIQNNEGYVSMTFLARFDDHQSFPRLPFEPISKEHYEQLMQEVQSRRKSDDLHALVNHHLKAHADLGPSDGACDAQGCMR